MRRTLTRSNFLAVRLDRVPREKLSDDGSNKLASRRRAGPACLLPNWIRPGFCTPLFLTLLAGPSLGQRLSAGELDDLFVPLQALQQPAAFSLRQRKASIDVSVLEQRDARLSASLDVAYTKGVIASALLSDLQQWMQNCSNSAEESTRSSLTAWSDHWFGLEITASAQLEVALPFDPWGGVANLFLAQSKASYSGFDGHITLLPTTSSLEIRRPSFLFRGIPASAVSLQAAQRCSWELASTAVDSTREAVIRLRTVEKPPDVHNDEYYEFDRNTRLPLARIMTIAIGSARFRYIELFRFGGGVTADSPIFPIQLASVSMGEHAYHIVLYDVSDYVVLPENHLVVLPIADSAKQPPWLIDARGGDGGTDGGTEFSHWPEFLKRHLQLVPDPVVGKTPLAEPPANGLEVHPSGASSSAAPKAVLPLEGSALDVRMRMEKGVSSRSGESVFPVLAWSFVGLSVAVVAAFALRRRLR